MIAVYFETTNQYAELVALFDDEDVYMACLPALEALAKENRMFVTDSEDYDINDLQKDWPDHE